MKFPLSWLREFVTWSITDDELAQKLTMAGVEVDAIENFGNSDENIVIAKIENISPHPNADKLSLCEVSIGEGNHLKIVCGANNVRIGLRSPLAKINAQILGQTIKKTNLRGIESEGMLCSAKELELVGLEDIYPGILELPDDAPIGQHLHQYLPTADKIFNITPTPNRGDCLSMIGLAREISAVVDCPINFDKIKPNPKLFNNSENDDTVPVSLNAGSACPQYFGRVVSDIKTNAKTPLNIQIRLIQCGERPIHPLVDITNYVMLETGQPTHAFDRDKISNISVRFFNHKKDQSKFKLLTGDERNLSENVLLITDNDKPTALGGVMGGLDSAISIDDNSSTKVFFESAHFTPFAIQGVTKELMISSEAAYRFERGVDQNISQIALDRACELASKICGGRIGNLSSAKNLEKTKSLPIVFHISKANKLIGYKYSHEQVENTLTKLGFEIKKIDSDQYEVIAPSWRFDIEIEEDLIEEIARIVGYDLVEESMPTEIGVINPKQSSNLNQLYWLDLCKILARVGFTETIHYGFVSEKIEKIFSTENSQPIELANPLTDNLTVMRSQLSGSLVETCASQNRNQQKSVRLFEISRVFKFDQFSHNLHESIQGEQGNYYQPYNLAMLIWGEFKPSQWAEPKRFVDFYDLKGEFETIFSNHNFEFCQNLKNQNPKFLHPARSAKIILNSQEIGFIGELHPQISQQFELPNPPIILECAYYPLSLKENIGFQPINRQPKIERDLSLIIPKDLASAEIVNLIDSKRYSLLKNITVFDVFRGDKLANEQKIIGLRLVLQSPSTTLTDEEVSSQIQEIISLLKQSFNINLR